ncbi:NADH:ubiquinone oxidoreductase subunit J [Thiohalorhabdus denitrificans]|uniref:NADH-quinone oxidoreductase subunit J n=1 Tax=Thiohalorhabdus denitrificans TaxID=381306 RepID=A0A0P9EGH6_9GAMM|nr:NADH-quinone oxidoreductase subunit J [Thiohalorhabdus denitrificans]KPV41632.1 NADH:ubiquinone oxidoreductase subunit J [Thiohalorhabdus denitrificans]SCY56846.1 NADH dehydrogenase subunit J [Thiohalorhabdus denitrificans]
MSALEAIFYLFATILVASAFMVISARNPVHSVLFLVLAFFNGAALFILAGAEFLGFTLILVYVGAVMVLFLFVIMMLDINLSRMREGILNYLPLGAVIAFILVVEMAMALTAGGEAPMIGGGSAIGGEETGNTTLLGRVLYTDYFLPFEVAALVLLVALVAAIALTLRRRPDSKYQEPGEQVQVRRGDRVRMVDMPSEGGQGTEQ